MTRRTRGSWRCVDVEDCDVGLVELDLESLNFDVGIGVEGDVDGGEGDGVVNKERHPPSPTTRAILVDESVAGERRDARIVVEFSLLDCCDADAVVVEEIPEFVSFSQDAVAIPLKKRWKRKVLKVKIRPDS